jgi:5-oxoprolinase (ATP-hydrolysing)
VGYSITSLDYQRENLGRSTPEEIQPVIGFDMGGTSTDVSRYHDQYEHIFETEISGVSI